MANFLLIILEKSYKKLSLKFLTLCLTYFHSNPNGYICFIIMVFLVSFFVTYISFSLKIFLDLRGFLLEVY